MLINSLYMFAVLALTYFNTVSAICSNANSLTHGCAAGCYNAKGIIFAGGVIHCEPVGAGYYSPSNSNERFMCSPGHYSNDLEASSCKHCEPGSIAGGRASTSCFLCPTGWYQTLPGQFTCLQCNPYRYDGIGSNSFEWNEDSTDIYCVLFGLQEPSTSPSASPSTIPSSSPSLSPSKRPSITPTSEPSRSPSRLPSKNPSKSPSMFPSAMPTSLPSMLPTLLPTLLPSLLPSLLPTLTVSSAQYDVFVPDATTSQSSNTSVLATLLLGVAMGVLVVAGVGFGFLYVKKSRRDEKHDNDTVLVTIGGELNQDNDMLDSQMETREEREYNDAMDNIEEAMESSDWSSDNDLELKKRASTCYNNNSNVVMAFAQVISVEECYGDEKYKQSGDEKSKKSHY